MNHTVFRLTTVLDGRRREGIIAYDEDLEEGYFCVPHFDEVGAMVGPCLAIGRAERVGDVLHLGPPTVVQAEDGRVPISSLDPAVPAPFVLGLLELWDAAGRLPFPVRYDADDTRYDARTGEPIDPSVLA